MSPKVRPRVQGDDEESCSRCGQSMRLDTSIVLVNYPEWDDLRPPRDYKDLRARGLRLEMVCPSCIKINGVARVQLQLSAQEQTEKLCGGPGTRPGPPHRPSRTARYSWRPAPKQDVTDLDVSWRRESYRMVGDCLHQGLVARSASRGDTSRAANDFGSSDAQVGGHPLANKRHPKNVAATPLLQIRQAGAARNAPPPPLSYLARLARQFGFHGQAAARAAAAQRLAGSRR